MGMVGRGRVTGELGPPIQNLNAPVSVCVVRPPRHPAVQPSHGTAKITPGHDPLASGDHGIAQMLSRGMVTLEIAEGIEERLAFTLGDQWQKPDRPIALLAINLTGDIPDGPNRQKVAGSDASMNFESISQSGGLFGQHLAAMGALAPLLRA